jgi:peroxiredoxin Q/BCP
MGIVRSTFLIEPAGNVVAEWRNVKVTGHVEEVLATLKSLRQERG